MDKNVHKDFHGGLSFGLKFLEEQYGVEGMEEFLSTLGGTVYKDLSDDLGKRGLIALRAHWRRIFDLEEGDIDMQMDGDTLVLHVKRCPAIHHMKEQKYAIAPHYCEHTRIVNESICRPAGFEATVEYDQENGTCVQRFRPVAGEGRAES
jgi:hypothetical protein